MKTTIQIGLLILAVVSAAGGLAMALTLGNPRIIMIAYPIAVVLVISEMIINKI